MSDTRYTFIRDAMPTDGKPLYKGRATLWSYAIYEDTGTDTAFEGGEIWLTPAQVKDLGLTDQMRTALGRQPQEMTAQVARSSSVPETPQYQRRAVSAEEWFRHDAYDEIPPEATTHAPGPHAGAEIKVEAHGGRTVDGWRFWIVPTSDGEQVAYDNKPMVDAWDSTSNTALPKLVQGVVPMALLQFVCHDPKNGPSPTVVHRDEVELMDEVRSEVMARLLESHQWERTRCPDDGKCHHECSRNYRGQCWRVFNASPLSGAGWEDTWPDEVVQREQAMNQEGIP